MIWGFLHGAYLMVTVGFASVSAAAFGWLLHQRLLDMRAAEIDPAFGSAAPVPAPSRGGVLDLAV